MNDSLKHKIFTETDCISEQTMFDYIDKKLSARESHSLEKHLLHCELCSDALDGLELTKDRRRIATIHQKISERLVSLQKEPQIIAFNYKLILSLAATVLLLIGGVFFFNQFNQKNEIAEFKSENTVTLSPPPPPAPSEVSSRADEIISDSINSGVLGTVKKENATEISEKAHSKKIEQKEQPAILEGQGAEPDSKASIATEAEAPGNGETYSPIVLIGENKKGGVIELSKSDNNSPKDELQERAKEIKLAENKNADAAGHVPGEESIQPTGGATVAQSKPLQSRDLDNDGLVDKSAKKTVKTTALFRTEAKEKRKAEKAGDDMGVSENIAYAPQSTTITNTAATATTADKNEESIEQTIADDESQLDQLEDKSKSVDQMPEFPGGQDSLLSFIQKNFKYPANYKTASNNIKKIYVNFIVDEKGKIKTPAILKGVNAALDKEALRVVNMMPKWKPGTNNGIPVSVKFELPIKLK